MPTRTRARKSEVARLPPGTVICHLDIQGRAVPWKTSTIPRKGRPYKDPRLVAWQREVALRARLAMGGVPPYAGPVGLVLTFTLAPRSGAAPDLCNLIKSTEDSIQGSIIVNDRQVTHTLADKAVGVEDLTTIRVVAL